MRIPYTIHLGDCLEVLKSLPDCSVDSIVTDPPYGLSDHKPADVIACLTAWLAGEEYRPNKKGFMGRTWDSWVPGPEVWREVFRVLKPGGHVVAFAGSRTHDLMSMALRLAGFEARDTIMELYATNSAAREFVDGLSDEQRRELARAMPAEIGVLWGYATGFPKSMDVSKAIDKHFGQEPKVVGRRTDGRYAYGFSEEAKKACGSVATAESASGFSGEMGLITEPATEEARQWSGFGTALKPAFEPALLFRKPLMGTVAENVLAHGTGALNIDGCRVPAEGDPQLAAKYASVQNAGPRENSVYGADKRDRAGAIPHDTGRFPANLIHDGSPEVVALFPYSAGSGGSVPQVKVTGYGDGIGTGKSEYLGGPRVKHEADAGSAARFFYCPKASKKDREEGLGQFDKARTGSLNMRSDSHAHANGAVPAAKANVHPTVKPTDLMRYLCRLVTPPGGTVLDPFAGSGSTGKAAMLEGFRFVGIEREPEYHAIAEARVTHAWKQAQPRPAQASREPSNDSQMALFAEAM